jgi:hypothetical protein
VGLYRTIACRNHLSCAAIRTANPPHSGLEHGTSKAQIIPANPTGHDAFQNQEGEKAQSDCNDEIAKRLCKMTGGFGGVGSAGLRGGNSRITLITS